MRCLLFNGNAQSSTSLHHTRKSLGYLHRCILDVNTDAHIDKVHLKNCQPHDSPKNAVSDRSRDYTAATVPIVCTNTRSLGYVKSFCWLVLPAVERRLCTGNPVPPTPFYRSRKPFTCHYEEVSNHPLQ